MVKKIYLRAVFIAMHSGIIVASSGIIFQGMTESGVIKNTFLCGKNSVTATLDAGSSVLADDCSIHQVQAAIGFDLSGGQTLQFFNNFMYWLRQQGQAEQNYQANTQPAPSDNDVDTYMQQQGWGAMGAYCILISTNEILQELIEPNLQTKSGETKVVVQLWYNGDNLIQLWSQDVAILSQGQSFTVAISNTADDGLATKLQSASGLGGYVATLSKIMQPNNCNQTSYGIAQNSPRMVRIQVS